MGRRTLLDVRSQRIQFGLFFEEEAVPEWRPKYINYAKVKRAIKDLEVAVLNPPLPEEPAPITISGGLVPVPEEIPPPPPSPHTAVIALLDRQLDKVEEFYREREAEAIERWNGLVAQIRLIEELEEQLRDRSFASRTITSLSEGSALGLTVPATLQFARSFGRKETELPNQPISVPAAFMRRTGTIELPKTPKAFKRPEWERWFTGMGTFVARSPTDKSGSGPEGMDPSSSDLSEPQSGPLMPKSPLALGPAASPVKRAPDTSADDGLRPLAPSTLLRHRTVTSSTSLSKLPETMAKFEQLSGAKLIPLEAPAGGRPGAFEATPFVRPMPSPLVGLSRQSTSPATFSKNVASPPLTSASMASNGPTFSLSTPATPHLLVAPLGNIRSLADARRNLKKVVMEFYRYLMLVHNFQSLNRGAFERGVRRMDEILRVAKEAEDTRRKKNDRKSPSLRGMEMGSVNGNSGRSELDPTVGKKWFAERVLKASFTGSTVVPKLINGTEDLYVRLSTVRPFGGEKIVPPSERRKLVRQLRLPPHTVAAAPSHVVDYGTSYRSGFLFGLMLPPFIASIYDVVAVAVGKPVFPDETRLMLQIHGGFLIPLLLLFLFAVNTVVYSRVQINYPFIFEFDPRDYLTPYQLMELALIATMLVCYSLYLSVGYNFLPFIPKTAYPAILAVVLIIMAIWPFNQFHRSARWWFLRTMGRIVVFNLGVGPVEFRDFFITDELNSITYTFTSVQAFVCAYTERWENLGATCTMGATYFIAVPTSFPALWRLSQCLLRWRQTGNAWPHGANAVKYIMSLLVIWFSTWSKISGLLAARVLWIVTAAISAVYSYAWDVYYDWGLLRIRNFGEKHFLLRKELRYSPEAVYYIAMILNAVLRVNWVFLISPSYWGILIDGRILALLFALLEVYRRFQWNFFRMENEHLNNCGLYRAVLDIPLPFRILEPPTDEKKAIREERKRVKAERAAERADKVVREATMRRQGSGLSLKREATGLSRKTGQGNGSIVNGGSPDEALSASSIRAPSGGLVAVGPVPARPPSTAAMKARDTGLSLEYTPRLVPEGLAMLAEDDDLHLDEELDLDDEDDEERADPADDDDSD